MGVKSDSHSQKSYTDIFNECFPFYLSIGMTYEEFWEGDVALPKFYREAYEIRLKREREKLNYSAWLNGLYFYEALCNVSPVLHAFAKKNTKPLPYAEKPYKFGSEPKENEMPEPDETEVQKERLKAQLFFNNFIHANRNKSI